VTAVDVDVKEVGVVEMVPVEAHPVEFHRANTPPAAKVRHAEMDLALMQAAPRGAAGMAVRTGFVNAIIR
jgi:hypothetical protein